MRERLSYAERDGTLFRDRADAGRRLGARLTGRPIADPLVLGLPRGGVEVAFEVARALHAPLDVIPARKLGAPFHAELAIGALAPGAVVLHDEFIHELGLTSGDISEVTGRERREMLRRAEIFRAGRPPLDLAGRTVIIVDDGLATGATAEAAIRSARRSGARAVILAVPVGAPDTVDRLRAEVDDLVCLVMPEEFGSVGQWYADFEQTTDGRVVELLHAAPGHRTEGT